MNPFCVVLLVLGQTVWVEQAVVGDPAASQFQRFGYSVAISGDTAVIGAPGAWGNGVSGEGNAFVFQRTGSTWELQQTLTGSGIGTDASFGSSVAISTDLIAVGAPGAIPGTAFVFERVGTTWSQTANLGHSGGTRYPASRSSNDGFGTTVAIAPGTVIVGAPLHDASTGTTYHFGLGSGSWSTVIRRSGSGLTAGSAFGASMSTNGSTAAVSSASAVQLFSGAGTTNWYEQGRLSVAGGRVAVLSGTSVVVGAPGTQVGANARQGVARVFESNLETAVLVAGDGAPNDEFGNSVAFSGDTVLVGARNDDLVGSVRAFVSNGTSWSEQGVLRPSAGSTGDAFGWSVALSGEFAVVGAPERNGTKGSAFFFVRQRAANGASCALPTDCTSGFCVDGACCDTACGGGATNDCQACSVAAGGATSGTCGSLSALAAAATVCRVASGVCDVEERCAPTSTACPANARAPSTTLCRPSTGECDVDEFCSGTSASCPAKAYAPSTTVCRAQAGECDRAETCSGSSAVCPTDQLAAPGTVCSNPECAAGVERLASSCTGASSSCPAAVQHSCAPFLCGATSCNTNCTTLGCASGFACEAGACIATVDAGQRDAGSPDAGSPDAGSPDAGSPDAGQRDAGSPDAGQRDAGSPDSGQRDAGSPEAELPDAGSSAPITGAGSELGATSGCGCRVGAPGSAWLLALVLLARVLRPSRTPVTRSIP